MAKMINRCPVCDSVIPSTAGKRGRPRVYCSKPCKAFNDRLTMLQSTILDGEIKFSKRAAERMRAELWALANDVRPFIDQDARDRFAEACKAKRADLGMTQAAFAELTGVARKQISRFERAEADPTNEQRRAILRAE